MKSRQASLTGRFRGCSRSISPCRARNSSPQTCTQTQHRPSSIRFAWHAAHRPQASLPGCSRTRSVQSALTQWLQPAGEASACRQGPAVHPRLPRWCRQTLLRSHRRLAGGMMCPSAQGKQCRTLPMIRFLARRAAPLSAPRRRGCLGRTRKMKGRIQTDLLVARRGNGTSPRRRRPASGASKGRDVSCFKALRAPRHTVGATDGGDPSPGPFLCLVAAPSDRSARLSGRVRRPELSFFAAASSPAAPQRRLHPRLPPVPPARRRHPAEDFYK